MRRDRVLAFAIGASAVIVVIALAIRARHGSEDERCAPGFVAERARCTPRGCPAPLVTTEHGCDAPRLRVAIPATTLTIGPSDWEAQGRVTPRTLSVGAFAIDAFELTGESARAASNLSYDDAVRSCAARGGRLPTEDEWIVAAAGERGTRYPWGDTGAVCRRAAWGLATGPCAQGGDGPDTVGAHPSGDSARGVHDLAGNVAEWVAAPEGASVAAVRGGSWRTSLAADLRTWARRELPKSTRADDVGARCAYDVGR